MEKKDFFISYNSHDKDWAEWIAWELEEAGYSVVIQAWDFKAADNFVLGMQKVAENCERTIAVLSQHYLNALFTQAEWTAAFVKDPTGEKGALIPVRIAECDLPGMWAPIIYIDLVGKEEEVGRKELLGEIKRERKKPSKRPFFPGSSQRVVSSLPTFPGLETLPRFYVPEAPSNFVGRSKYLNQLKERLFSESSVVPLLTGRSMVGIYGMAGVGKSYLALQFAYESQLQEVFEGIYWQVCGENTLDTVVVELARKLDIDISELPPEKVLATVKKQLSQQCCLLILDDIQNEVMGEILPGGRASVIITTRRKDLPFLVQHNPLIVEEFSEKECMELFKRMIPELLKGNEQEAKYIFKVLGYLPIAISVTARMLKNDMRWSFSKLLNLFKEKRDEVLSVLECGEEKRNISTHYQVIAREGKVQMPPQDVKEDIGEIYRERSRLIENINNYTYDVVLSFAGEDRKMAKELSVFLIQSGVTVFYDENERAELLGKDLYQYLQKVYQDSARFCIVLISQFYVKKNWTRHELKQAQARAFRENREYILPVRIDDTELPGLSETISYLDARTMQVFEIAAIILDKLRRRV